MIWDYKNIELKRFIQKTLSIKDDVPDTIKEEGYVWVKTRRIELLYKNIKTGEQKVIDNDLYPEIPLILYLHWKVHMKYVKNSLLKFS